MPRTATDGAVAWRKRKKNDRKTNAQTARTQNAAPTRKVEAAQALARRRQSGESLSLGKARLLVARPRRRAKLPPLESQIVFLCALLRDGTGGTVKDEVGAIIKRIVADVL